MVLPAEPDEVWATLTTPEELSAWLGDVVALELEPGGSLVVRENEGATRRGVVEAADPGRILSFRWRRLAGPGVSLEVGGASRVSSVRGTFMSTSIRASCGEGIAIASAAISGSM